MYLVKNVIRELKTSCSSEKNDRKCEDSEEAPQRRDQLLQWEYNVAYSVSYEAPVLYFDICRSGKIRLQLYSLLLLLSHSIMIILSTRWDDSVAGGGLGCVLV